MEQFNQMLFSEDEDKEKGKLIAALRQLTTVKDLGPFLDEMLPDSPAWTGWW